MNQLSNEANQILQKNTHGHYCLSVIGSGRSGVQDIEHLGQDCVCDDYVKGLLKSQRYEQKHKLEKDREYKLVFIPPNKNAKISVLACARDVGYSQVPWDSVDRARK